MDKKRLVAYVLAITLASGYVAPVAYASENTKVLSQQEKIQVLEDKNILLGKKFNKDSSDSLSLTDEITRSEITKLLVYTIGREELAKTLDGVTKPFPDVELGHWANGFISAAATTDIQKGQYRLVIGDENGMFMPEQQITYGELATTLLRAVRPNINETGMIYPKDYVEAAEREGIFKGISKVTVNKPVVRSEAFEMVYNAYVKLGTVPKTYTDNIGIVRKVSGWGILANQTIRFDDDNSTSYRVSDEFKVTSGAEWDKVARNQVDDVVKYGILTKYVLDEDNRVSHLVELGNDLNGVISKDRFNTLFKIISNGTAFETNDYEGTNDNVSVFDSYKITGDGLRLELVNNNSSSNTEVELTENTKVYILQGDKVYNLRTENDKKNNLPKLDPSKIRVYGAFENENNRNNAIVLVFSAKVEKSETDLYKDAENAINAYRKDNSTSNRQRAENALKKLADSNKKTRLQDILNEGINIDNAKIALSKFKQTPTSFNREAAKTAIEKIISSNIKNELFKELKSIPVNDKITEKDPNEEEKIAKAKKALDDYKNNPSSNELRQAAYDAITSLKDGDIKNKLANEYNSVDEPTDSLKKSKENVINRLKDSILSTKDEFINRIDNAKTEEEIKFILDEYNKAIESFNSEEVKSKKTQSKNEIKKLDGLTEDEIKSLESRIDSQAYLPNIQDIVNEANKLNKDRKDMRQAGVNQINTYQNLSNESKANYIDEINKQVISEGVSEITLKAFKEDSVISVKNLVNLSDEQKTAFKEKINNQTSIDDINKVLEEAKGLKESDLIPSIDNENNPNNLNEEGRVNKEPNIENSINNIDTINPNEKPTLIRDKKLDEDLVNNKKPFSLTETLLQLVK